MAPLAASAHQVEQAVQQPAHVGAARSAAGLGRRDQGLEQGVLLIAQGLPGTEIADEGPALSRPHACLQEGLAPLLNGQHSRPASSRAPPQTEPGASFSNGLSDLQAGTLKQSNLQMKAVVR